LRQSCGMCSGCLSRAHRTYDPGSPGREKLVGSVDSAAQQSNTELRWEVYQNFPTSGDSAIIYQLSKTAEWACKPGFVESDHFSGMPIARHLKQPTRRSLGTGQAPAAQVRHPSARPCSGWGLPGQPSHPDCRCALTAPFHPYLIPPDRSQAGHRRYLFCGTFPDLTTGRRYRPPCPAEPGLSSLSSRSEFRRQPKTQNSDHSAHSAEM
jgi:hypothetical protein